MPKTSFRVVTDSTADLPPAWREKYDIEVVPLKVLFGNESFRDGVDLTNDEFFRKLASSSQLPTTSAPSPGDFAGVYEKLSRECEGVVSIHLGSNLSATCESARLGAQSVEGFPVHVIDSGSATMTIAFLCRTAAEAEDLEAAVKACEERVPKLGILALLDTMRYIQMGGRIGRVQYLLGSMLDVKPLLKLDHAQPEIQALDRMRTRARAIPGMVERLNQEGPLEHLAVMHGSAPEDAEKLRALLAPGHPEMEPEVGQIGAVLGTHTGPRALGLVYVKK
ncbi:MAG: DegV family protein [Chloroflexi bacterium]|nr:MAG: DegV family protein [Chloroflexota bacterium]